MHNIIATEIDLVTYDHLRYFKFPLDGDKDFCYRSRMSYSAFAHSIKKRNRKQQELLYHCDNEIFRINTIDSNLPFIECATLWDFYEAIGYEYRLKKWLT